jgi:hypothetical protein
LSLLRELIEGASGDTVAVATLLRKVKVLAARMRTGELAEWVEHELSGYPLDAKLPEYRGPFRADVLGTFGGPFGTGIKNAPIPPIAFPEEYREGSLFNIEFRERIAELEKLSEPGKEPLVAYWPADAILLVNSLIQQGRVASYPQMWLQQAWQTFSPANLAGIVDMVRTRILDLALSLEEVAPEAGEPNVVVPNTDRIQSIVTNVYGGTPNIAVASRSIEQNIVLPTAGNLEELFNFLSEFSTSTEWQ